MITKQAAKQQRIENILLSLKRFDYLTRSQIQAIHDLKGERNANRILNDMNEYLGRFRNELEYVYYLNKEGRRRVNCDVVRKKTSNINHFLLRNQLWMHLKRPHTWENEIKIKVGDISIICDAKYTLKGGVPVFIEVDTTQTMAENKNKVERYKKIHELTGQKFYLVWVTQVESRLPKLQALCKGLEGRVYTLKEIK